jgi:hypothetical protein
VQTVSDIWLNYCLLESPINRQQETGYASIVLEWQCVLPSLFQDSKQTDIEFLEDLGRLM